MRTYRLVFLCCGLILSQGWSASAQDAVFSQHFAIPLYLNPAFAGANAGTRLAGSHRSMPVAGFLAFSSSLFSLDAHVPALHGGLGLMALRDDQDGLQEVLGLAGIYAYHAQVSRNAHMHFALQAGYHSARAGDLDFADPRESYPPPEPIHGFDLGAGWVFFTPRFYAGLSAHHLNRPRIGWYEPHPARMDIKYTAHLGMHLQARPHPGAQGNLFDYFLSPNIIFQQQGDGQGRAARLYHLGLYGGRELHGAVSQLAVGIWHRSSWHDKSPGDDQRLIIMLGLISSNNLRVAYSFDWSLKTPLHAHELSLAYLFPGSAKSSGNHIIKLPAF